MTRRSTADRFRHHVPTNPRVTRAHETVRLECLRLAATLEDLLPACDERDQALDRVDHACMLANAAIARTQLREE